MNDEKEDEDDDEGRRKEEGEEGSTIIADTDQGGSREGLCDVPASGPCQNSGSTA